MRTTRVLNLSKNTVLAERGMVADTFFRRGWGLLGRSCLESDEALVITHTNSIHSVFMRFTFDALYVARDGRIRRLLPEFTPFRLGPLDWGTDLVIELSVGTIARKDVAVDDIVFFDPPIRLL